MRKIVPGGSGGPKGPIWTRHRLQSMRSLKHRCFWGAVSVGCLAGGLEAWLAGEPARVGAYKALTGLIGVMVGGFFGGFFGMTVKNLLGILRGYVPDRDVCIEGVVLGGFWGAFCALLLGIAVLNLEQGVLTVALGALLGSFLGSLPGEMVIYIADLLHAERTGTPIRPAQPDLLPLFEPQPPKDEAESQKQKGAE